MTRESLIASYKKAYPESLTYREQADAILKSLDKSHLQRVPIVDKNGVHKHVWKNLNKKAKEKKPAPQPEAGDVPTIELEPLPKELKAENCEQKEFRELLFSRFAGKRVQNKNTKANILIPKSGIKHSVSNRYPKELQDFSRASIWQLNRLLHKAKREEPEADKNNNRNILNVDKYLIIVKLKDKRHFVQIVVKNYIDTGENFYDHLIIKKEVAAHQGVTNKSLVSDDSRYSQPLPSFYRKVQKSQTRVRKTIRHPQTGKKVFAWVPKQEEQRPEPKENPEDSKECPCTRWSFCDASLALAQEHGFLFLEPMEERKTPKKWVPFWRKRSEIAKSYALKPDERWITVHPNGEDEKGQPVLVKEHKDGTASVIAGAGGRLNGLRLRKTKSKEEYRQKVQAKRDQIKAQKEQSKEREKAKEAEMNSAQKVAYRQGKQTKRKEWQAQRNELKQQKDTLQEEKAHEIAAQLGWQVQDLDEPFAKRKQELQEKLAGSTDKKEQRSLQTEIAQTEKAHIAAKKQQASNIIAQAKGHAEKFKRQLLDDEEMREAAKAAIGDDADQVSVELISVELKESKGLGIKKDYENKAPLTDKEKAEAQKQRDKKLAAQHGQGRVDALNKAKESIKRQAEIAEAHLEQTEYAAPEDSAAKIATLKAVMEYEKQQKQIQGKQKQIEKIDPTELSLQKLKEELANSRFGDGVNLQTEGLSADDLDKALEKAEYGAQTERQAALHSTLHDEFAGNALSQKKWVANGAYNALNAVSMDVFGVDGLSRDIVDILGASNAAQVLANQIQQNHQDAKDLKDAAKNLHIAKNEEIAQDALGAGQNLLRQAEELDEYIAQNAHEPARVKDLVERKQALVDRASAMMGGALGNLEASAALAEALGRGEHTELSVNLGKVSWEEAAQQAKILGLSLNDVDIESVNGERLMSIPTSAWGKIAGRIDKEEARVRTTVAEIKAGLQDEVGWLPHGIMSRPFESFEAPPKRQKAKGTFDSQELEDNSGLTEAMHRSLSKLPEASMAYKDSAELTPQEQTALRRYWEREIFAGSGASETAYLREAQKEFRDEVGAVGRVKAWNDFVAQNGGSEAAAFEAVKSDAIENHSTTDMFGEKELHYLANVVPGQADTYRAIPEAREYFDAIDEVRETMQRAEAAGEKQAAQQYRTELAKQEAELPENLEAAYHTAMKNHYLQKMSGIDSFQFAMAEEREQKTPWGEYVHANGDDPEQAQQNVIEHLRGKFHNAFRENYARTNKQWLRKKAVKMQGATFHVQGMRRAEDRQSFMSQNEREMASAAARVGKDASGKFVAGKRREEAVKLMQKERDAQQAKFFSEEAMKQDDGTDITRLGGKVEAKLSQIMEEHSSQFEHGKRVELFGGLSMEGRHIVQQRAIKMLEATKKMQLSFGTGSGKSLSSIGAFTHLHGQGKVKRALYAVPSVVQEQFGGEMHKYAEPGKFHWESRAGLSSSERIAALQDQHNQINVVSHHSLRNDIVYLLARHENTGEEQAKNRFNAMNEAKRAEHLKKVLAENGIDHDMLVVDESHYASDRQGKKDSTLSNILGALGRNSEYLLRQSATPVKNDISEAYHMLHVLAPDKYSDWNEFAGRYGLDTAASRRALQSEISRYNYASPTETGVKRNYKQEKVLLSPKQQEALKQVEEAAKKARISSYRGKLDIDAFKVLSPKSFLGDLPEGHELAQTLEKLHEKTASKLAQALGTLKVAAENRVINESAPQDNAKIQRLAEIIQNKGAGTPGVVFAHNRQAVAHISDYLAKQGLRTGVMHGGHTGKEKEQIRRQFNPPGAADEDRKYDVLVMSDAGATGMNLQNAKYLVNYDLPDTSWVKQQREGRIDRHGQQHTEIDYHDLVSDTKHDEVKLKRIQRKAKLGSIFEEDPNSYDDRGILSYLHKAKQESLFA